MHTLRLNPTNPTSGIKAVADCVREQGMLLGIYGDSGELLACRLVADAASGRGCHGQAAEKHGQLMCAC